MLVVGEFLPEDSVVFEGPRTEQRRRGEAMRLIDMRTGGVGNSNNSINHAQMQETEGIIKQKAHRLVANTTASRFGRALIFLFGFYLPLPLIS